MRISEMEVLLMPFVVNRWNAVFNSISFFCCLFWSVLVPIRYLLPLD